MKILFYFLFIGLFLVSSCTKSDTVVVINNVASDTSFVVKRGYKPSWPVFIWWRAEGTLDDSTNVLFKSFEQDSLISQYIYTLPKGRVETPLYNHDYYKSEVQVIYKHRNAKKGKLTITIKDW